VKKRPENRISVVSGECGGTRDQPAYDRSFEQRSALPARQELLHIHDRVSRVDRIVVGS
jgi:hypothetical protein